MNTGNDRRYPTLDPVSTGMKCRCPRCGQGKLYAGVLKVTPRCAVCGLSFEERDEGDGPTVFIIMGLGFLILGAALFVELNYAPPTWVHIMLWPPLILLLGLPAIRIAKGVLMSLQYHHNASEGRLDTGSQEER